MDDNLRSLSKVAFLVVVKYDVVETAFLYPHFRSGVTDDELSLKNHHIRIVVEVFAGSIFSSLSVVYFCKFGAIELLFLV